MGTEARNLREEARTGNDIARRLGAYGGEILDVSEDLPDTKLGRHVRDQLLRSGTAPGAHYAEARSAQSGNDFVHKLALAAKEVRESLHWLRIVRHSAFVDGDLSSLIEEADELVAILFQSLRTARSNNEVGAEG